MRKPFVEKIAALGKTSDTIDLKRIDGDVVVYDLYSEGELIASDRYRKTESFNLSEDEISEISSAPEIVGPETETIETIEIQEDSDG